MNNVATIDEREEIEIYGEVGGDEDEEGSEE